MRDGRLLLIVCLNEQVTNTDNDQKKLEDFGRGHMAALLYWEFAGKRRARSRPPVEQRGPAPPAVWQR